MDILLIAASGLLTTYIPQQCLAWTTATATTTISPSKVDVTHDDNKNRSLTNDDDKKNHVPSSSSSSSYSIFGYNQSKNTTSNSILFTISLGLSLLLFSLNILELFPQSWLLWIGTSRDAATFTSSITIISLYRFILWMIAIHCTIVIPSDMSIAMMMKMMYSHQRIDNRSDVRIDRNSSKECTTHTNQGDDADDRKKRNHPPPHKRKRRHWIARICYYTLSASTKLVASTLLYYIFYPFYRTVQYYILIPVLQKFIWCCQCRYSFLPTTTASTSNQHRINRLFIVRCWNDPILRKCVFYGSTIGISVSALLLRSIYPLVIEQQVHQDQHHDNESNILLHCIKSLCAIGIIISTILNGFGSISLPYTCIAGLFVEPIPYDIIRNAELELDNIKVNLNNKIQDFITTSNEAITVPLGSVNSNSSNSTSQTKLSSSFWMRSQKKRGIRRILSDFTNDATSLQRQKTATLLSEIEFLETLIDDMTINVDEMRYTQSISSDARSTFGKFRSYMGIFFSILLFSRLLAAMSNVGKQYSVTSGLLSSFWRPTPTSTITTEANIDLVTQIVLWLSGLDVATTETLHSISQCISLSLTALLSISQMRVFLRMITTIQRRMNAVNRKCYCQPFRFGCNDYVSRHQRHRKMKLSTSFTDTTIASYMSLQSDLSPKSYNDGNATENGSPGNAPEYNIWFFSHPISFLLCCYCLACIVLTKMMLPIEYRTNFSNALLFLTSTNDHHHPTTTNIFTIRTYTIDFLYSTTALISGTILAITLSFMRSNVRRIQKSSNINYDDNTGATSRSKSFHAAPKSSNRTTEGLL